MHPGGLEHGADCGVVRAGQLAEGPRGVLADLERCDARGPSPVRPGGPTRVGVSNPASTSRQAARAASRSRPDSQVTNLRYGAAGGKPLAVVTGEDLLQHDGQ